MGNGQFARHNGGKILKMGVTPAKLGKGYLQLVCTTCSGVWSIKMDKCLRCSWKNLNN